MTRAAAQLDTTTMAARPRYEGSNIRTWIGFKHFMYIVEDAVLQWFREHGAGPQELYHAHGLALEILDCSVQLPALLEIDDELLAHVTLGRQNRLDVRLEIARGNSRVLGLRGKVTVGLLPEPAATASRPAPASLARFVRDDVDEACPTAELSGPVDGAAFRWDWRARYFHCHFSDRVQHSAYVRALEEVVDRFLVDRGMSIRTLLDSRGWIPVVSRARVQLVATARMEETIQTSFTVTEILKGLAFQATMDCHVRRDGGLLHVATAGILHGYAMSRGPDAGRLVELDELTQTTLLGVPAP